jgi:ATP-binding cassette subfamily G (WHITE) protein 2 (PDR)
VLYDGQQIYFGNTKSGRAYFEAMGFDCPERQTTPDFLTSLSNPAERVIRAGWEQRVPRTADEFAARWRDSPERQQLLRDIDAYEREFPVGGEQLEKFKRSRVAEQARHQRWKSPYTISVPMQVRLCIGRGFERLKGDLGNTIATVFGNTLMALIISSVFFK